MNQDSYSNLGKTYQPPPGYEYDTPETKALLGGSEYFTPSEIEVFQTVDVKLNDGRNGNYTLSADHKNRFPCTFSVSI